MNKSLILKPLDRLLDGADHFRTAVYFTFGADLGFFEEAILNPLWHAGCRHHLIFMDARRYLDTISMLSGAARWVGRRYLVVPVDLGPYQAFHPKMVFLTGPTSGRLLLGSGNLTSGGYGRNLELLSLFEWREDDPDYLPVFKQAWEFIGRMADFAGLDDETLRMLSRIPADANWLTGTNAAILNEMPHFLHTLDAPLLEQVQQLVAGPIERMRIVTPFLDREARAVQRLRETFQPASTQLIVQPGSLSGDISGVEQLAHDGIEFHALTDLAKPVSPRYLHAKLVVLEGQDNAWVISGSANATAPAWLRTARDGNIETCLATRATHGEVKALVGNYTQPVSLTTIQETGIRPIIDIRTAGSSAPPIRIQHATLEGRVLHIVLELSHEEIRACPASVILESRGLVWAEVEPEVLPGGDLQVVLDDRQFAWFEQPRSIRVRVKVEDRAVSTPPVWVIQISALRRERSRLLSSEEQAASILSDMHIASDREWGELYKVVSQLVDLQAATMQREATHKRTLPALPRVQGKRIEVGGETFVEFADASEDPVLREEAVQYEESRLADWMRRIQAYFPGEWSTPMPRNASDNSAALPVPGDLPEKPDRHPPEPPPDATKRRFLRLVDKFITSLSNPDFMKSVSIYYLLNYVSLFHRMLWLLYTHEALKTERFLKLSRTLNEALLGGAEQTAWTLVTPTTRRHLHRQHEHVWLDTSTAAYVMCSLAAGKRVGELQSEESDTQTDEYVAAAILGLALAVPIEELLASVSDEVLYVYQEIALTEEEVLVTTRERLQEVIALLAAREKPLSLLMAAKERDTDEERALLLARLSYGRSYLELLRYCGAGINEQVEVAEHYARLSRLTSWNGEFLERLATLHKEAGDFRAACEQRILLARRLFRDKRYEEAVKQGEMARQLAEELGEDSLVVKAHRVVRNASFMLPQ